MSFDEEEEEDGGDGDDDIIAMVSIKPKCYWQECHPDLCPAWMLTHTQYDPGAPVVGR